MIKPGDYVAITGGSGFIGRYLSSALHGEGFRPVSVGRGENSERTTDYSFGSLVQALKGVQAVVHLGARRMFREDDPLDLEPFIQPNIVAVGSLGRAAAECGVKRIILASTRGVYSGSNSPPYQESEPPRPATGYGLSKLSAEVYLNMLGCRADLTTISLRLAATFGHGERGTPVLMKFIDQAIKGETLRLLGNPTYPIDQLYVKDAVTAFLCALRLESGGGVFNIGGGRSWRLEEIALTVNEVFDNVGNVESVEGDWQLLPEAHMNISKASNELGWSPRFDLRAGLEDLRKERLKENGLSRSQPQ